MLSFGMANHLRLWNLFKKGNPSIKLLLHAILPTQPIYASILYVNNEQNKLSIPTRGSKAVQPRKPIFDETPGI
ncbi:hypothetical protein AYI69_g7315 [Smittium culicis]|uniref:Uncharacterized protein n=1 Tax=Smittium culicis TaxID=133412 RepID=A0A1R1XSW1_9FUNG|nr:hypothetical protein AYI69_g9320 [Smittium culicis]OMJ17743.1 hypothetical protein AYI69_g7315 [Smittium culicis]